MRMNRHLRALVAVLLGLATAGAHAVLITFDDLPPTADPGQFAGTSVTDEYAALGLIVNEGYLAGSGVPGTNQSLYGAPYLSLSFIGGTLPTYVSLYVSAAAQRLKAQAPSNKPFTPCGALRQYCGGALTWAPSAAAACQGQRGS